MLRTKAHRIDYILKMLYTWEEWEKEDNILRGKNPIIHTSAFQYVTVWHSKLMPVCFYSAFCESAGAAATAPLNISCSSNFYAPANDSEVSIHFTNQNTMSLPSHVGALAADMLPSFFCLINQ